MAKAFKFAFSAASKIVLSNSSSKLLAAQAQRSNTTLRHCLANMGRRSLSWSSRARSIMSMGPVVHHHHSKGCCCFECGNTHMARYSTEVEKEISKFLEKEIKYETSRSSDKLPKISGFDIQTEGSDVTLTRTSGTEKIVIKLNVNGAVDSATPEDETATSGKENEPPKMVCRPPFDVEITKGKTVLALQCAFPAPDAVYEQSGQESDRIDDQFEIQEVSIHGGEWKDTTYSVSAATMDAELFDLLMDLLDERGINDEFITQLVNYCTAYENKLYIGFLQNLKSFVEN